MIQLDSGIYLDLFCSYNTIHLYLQGPADIHTYQMIFDRIAESNRVYSILIRDCHHLITDTYNNLYVR